MFLDHFVKLELIPRLGLKNSTFTPGVPTLLGFRMFLLSGVQLLRMFLSTYALLNAAPVTIAFEIIVLSGDKLLGEIFTREFSRKFVTRIPN